MKKRIKFKLDLQWKKYHFKITIDILNKNFINRAINRNYKTMKKIIINKIKWNKIKT